MSDDTNIVEDDHEVPITLPEGFELVRVRKVERVRPFLDEWVYDIEVDSETPYFFANNILVHNSVYASMKWFMDANGIETNTENAVVLADEIGSIVNDGIPDFCNAAFLVGSDKGNIVKAGREVVARKGLFKNVKKRYALHVVNTEGKSKEYLKIMGMETRRSDTPVHIQDFLETCIKEVVMNNKSYEEIKTFVNDFREAEYAGIPVWKRGSPGRVSNLTNLSKKITAWQDLKTDGYVDAKKPLAHYSVTAAINTNKLMELNNETRWDYIRDGDKIQILYLKPNIYEMNLVAIKSDEIYVPDWFKELPFDNTRHEQKFIDKKLFNVLGEVLGWDFGKPLDYSDEVMETDNFFGL